MTWHKWLVRGLVCTLFTAAAAVCGVYALWTSPAAVRQLVQGQLGVRLVRVAVQVGSAQLRLLGGILVRELRLARTESLDNQDFLYVPSAVIFHDKERLLDGKVAVRKIELDRPELRIIRQRDGRFNVSGVLGPVDLRERIPTITVHGGSIVFDCREAGPGSVLEVRNVELTLINDPLPMAIIEGTGEVDVLGPVSFRATLDRATWATQVEVKLTAVPAGKALVERIGRYSQALREHLENFTGQAEVTAMLNFPGQGAPPRHEVSVRLHHGRFEHPRLPAPLEQMEVTATIRDSTLVETRLKGAIGSARVEARLAGLDLRHCREACADLESRVKELDVLVTGLNVDGDLIRRLPANLQNLEAEYAPVGPANIRYTYRHPGPGPLVKEWAIEPQGMTGRYFEFPYPVEDVRGLIWIDTSHSPLRNVRIELNGQAGGTRVFLTGTIKGERGTGPVDLNLEGRGCLLDGRLLKALPARVHRIVAQFLPDVARRDGFASAPFGRAGVRASFCRQAGSETVEKRFQIQLEQASVLYDQFPYPLEAVSGEVIVLPDHWECRNCRGSHSGGEIVVEGRSFAATAPAGAPPTLGRIEVTIQGRDILLDQEFERALSPLTGESRKNLQHSWRTLRLSGRLSFGARVIDHPGIPNDIDVSVNVEGCRMRPRFFDYDLEGVSAEVRYARNRVTLKNMKAQHGPGRIALSSGLIQLNGEGAFTAWLTGLTGQDLPAGPELVAAVPEPMRGGMEALRIKTPVNVALNLTLVHSATGAGQLEVWWEGALGLRQARFQSGLEVREATGQFYCKGYHDGRKLRGVSGQLQLDHCRVLDQPVKKMVARFDIEPRSPDILRIRDMSAELFSGTLAGQGRVEIAPTVKYDVLLEAIGVQLDAFGKHNLGESAQQAHLSGPARAAVHLVGEGSELIGLKGNGRIDIQKGKMGQLPVLLDLLKAFGLRMPDRTAFEKALVVFSIEGPRMLVRQLELFGNAVSLHGEGALDLDGSNLELDFSATFGRIGEILPAGIDLIPQAISGQFLKIKMRGKLGKGGQVRFDKELIPGVTEPLRRVLGGTE